MKKQANKKLEIIILSISAVFALIALALMMRNDSKVISPALGHAQKIAEAEKSKVLIDTPLAEKITTPKGEKIVKDASVENGNVSLNAGEVSIKIEADEVSSLYDLLIKAKNSGKISVETKEYPGLGFYVTHIGNLSETSGKHLIYYVNGVDATVGISSYIPKQGDIIDWKLE